MAGATEIAAHNALMRRKVRVASIFVALACLTVLGVAAWLTPDPRGFGTHQQLGLPPCISEQYLGIPCPLCGMTTSFTLMADARPGDALRTQPAGVVFFIATSIVAAGAISSAFTGYIPPFVRRFVGSKPVTVMVFVVLTIAWIFKIVHG